MGEVDGCGRQEKRKVRCMGGLRGGGGGGGVRRLEKFDNVEETRELVIKVAVRSEGG